MLIVLAAAAKELPHAASALEQEHIRQALEASGTAMNAINTILQVSTLVLGVLGVGVAILALFGWTVMRDAVVKNAKQIANERLDSYMKGEEFEALAFDLVQRAVDKRWQNTVVVQTFQSTARDQNDANPFPNAPDKAK